MNKILNALDIWVTTISFGKNKYTKMEITVEDNYIVIKESGLLLKNIKLDINITKQDEELLNKNLVEIPKNGDPSQLAKKYYLTIYNLS